MMYGVSYAVHGAFDSLTLHCLFSVVISIFSANMHHMPCYLYTDIMQDLTWHLTCLSVSGQQTGPSYLPLLTILRGL
jgi:hypothetical protein